MLKTDCDFNLDLDPNCIDSVLPKCRESLLSTSHSLTISSSFCKTVSMLDKHLSATKIAESDPLPEIHSLYYLAQGYHYHIHFKKFIV